MRDQYRRRIQRGMRVRKPEWAECDESGHESSMNCWCKPVIVYVTERGSVILIHRTDASAPVPAEMQFDLIAECAFAEGEFEDQLGLDSGEDGMADMPV
jgi:hypothetical protein